MRNQLLGKNIYTFTEKLFATHSISNDDARTLETIFSFFAQENAVLKEVGEFTRSLKLSKSEIDAVLQSILADFDPDHKAQAFYGGKTNKKRSSLASTRKYYHRGKVRDHDDEISQEQDFNPRLRPLTVNMERLKESTLNQFRKC